MDDIRWIQRFDNYTKALQNLQEFLVIEKMNKFEKQGFVKAFEYTYELAWKTLQDFLKEQGYSDVAGPKAVISKSFEDGHISDGQGWSRMHETRNLTDHLYDEKFAEMIVEKIASEFIFLFQALQQTLDAAKTKQLKSHVDRVGIEIYMREEA